MRTPKPSPKALIIAGLALLVAVVTGLVTLLSLAGRFFRRFTGSASPEQTDEVTNAVSAGCETASAQTPSESSAPVPADAGASRPARTRREILTLLSGALVGGAGIIVAVPVVSALVAPLTRPQPPEWRGVGPLDDFEVGTTTLVRFEDPSPLSWSGVASQTAAWLRRTGPTQFTAFAINCTHLGCPIRWIPDGHLFMCPCHGGVFYEDGTVAAGPPELPLYQYPVRVRGGQVEVQSNPVPIV